MFSVEIEVHFRDVDLFGRVNSAVVASYTETARYRYPKDRLGRFGPCFVIARAEIYCLKPIFICGIIPLWRWNTCPRRRDSTFWR